MKRILKFLRNNKSDSQISYFIKEFASQHGIPDDLHIEYVFSALLENPDLCPITQDSPIHKETDILEIIKPWVGRFKRGYEMRISQRPSQPTKTIQDPAVPVIICTVLPNTKQYINYIIHSHRLCMSAENILGLLLEEFLFSILKDYGWAMAWGETIKHVDFCSANGCLLQVKNRSNSENSSSKTVRNEKNIKKWYRINANNGTDNWDALIDIIVEEQGIFFEEQEDYFLHETKKKEFKNCLKNELNEKKFQDYIINVLNRNKGALAIESENPLGKN